MTTIQRFIKKRKYLVWYVKDPGKLDNEAIVEAVLNYGDWDDVQEMIKILGIKEVAKIFREKYKQKRCNYHPKTKNYFNLYFNKYAKQ
ncbi:hypothetical protein KJ756_00430 [Patescibacteria group bacterium]|nr:hypothetical protein [Patescibacteria group bacterium]MBU4082725.1 hypothetical protein [Patescibacteria group bacterium]MCG2809691.1 hypothetical protein [Candidatus Portnoybacteria bacterium]